MPTLSVSDCCRDCAADGPAELKRVGGGIDGASWLDNPVDGDSVMWTLLEPLAVFDMAAAASGCKVLVDKRLFLLITRTKRYG